MEKIWEDRLTEEDRQVIERAEWTEGLNDTRDIGDNPAIVVIDVQHSMVGPKAPLVEAAEVYKTAIGERAWDAVDEISELLSTAREYDVPIYYFHVPHDDPEGAEIIEDIAPTEGDKVIKKPSYSAFFGTDFTRQLIKDNIDTLVVVGGSTSGCVRATVTDADMHGFGVIVPPECVFDRIQVSHDATLLDIWMKRGQVQPRQDVEEYLKQRSK